jgi:hypothetical protein
MKKKQSPSKSRRKEVLKPAVPIEKLGSRDFKIPNIDKSDTGLWQKRVLIFTPTLGSVRMEWVQARYAQITPTNWSFVDIIQFLNPYVPIGYQLPDAQNLMAKNVVEGDYEWVVYIESDNVLPNDAFLRFNQYINEQNIPVVSGLYWIKAPITEPLLYRGRGTSYFKDWKLGDRVWVDGIPFGFRLEHASLIKAAWKESEEYEIGGIKTRRVFKQPSASWYDKDKGGMVSTGGTTDLEWCRRIIEEKLFQKAGWPEFQKKKYPFLVDTNIFVKHITPDGVMYPLAVPSRFIPEDPNYKGREVT